MRRKTKQKLKTLAEFAALVASFVVLSNLAEILARLAIEVA